MLSVPELVKVVMVDWENGYIWQAQGNQHWVFMLLWDFFLASSDLEVCYSQDIKRSRTEILVIWSSLYH